MANMIKFHILVIVVLFFIKGLSYIEIPKIQIKANDTNYIIHYNETTNVLTLLKEPKELLYVGFMIILCVIGLVLMFVHASIYGSAVDF